jgi:uncharacterized membrane protein YhaH (DUF805 family)
MDNRFFSFTGRYNRAKFFWIFFWTVGGVYICLGAVLGVAVGARSQAFDVAFFFLSKIAILGLLICPIVKRLHDFDLPGTYFWLALIPIYNIYVLFFRDGTQGPNRYGPDLLRHHYWHDNRFFSFTGRYGRAKFAWSSFWIVFCVTLIIQCLTLLVVAVGVSRQALAPVHFILRITAPLGFLSYPLVKRLHDLDLPGTYFWLALIPLYNIYLLFFRKGTEGLNRYGPDPLEYKYRDTQGVTAAIKQEM